MSLRVIFDGPRDPWLNMALDEALARHASDVLRIYMWSPGAVSIGRRQSPSSVRREELERLGLKLVRRPTGGAAIFHAEGGELTYSVVLGKGHPFYALDVASSAAKIAEGIVLAIKELGGEAQLRGYSSQGESEYCYLNPAASDVLVRGKKVSGSAQRREWGVLLQHGTLLLSSDAGLAARLIEGAADVTAGLFELMGEIPVSRAMRALAEGFTRALGYRDFQPSSFLPEELETALRLYHLKYSRPSWNLEGRLEAGEV
ncbi:MAG: lipoate--protein ligase family protein [Acidilobaceae archaeon]|nr:lipoate--protein ligase family protein [Acidilobaceae archaeon]MCX8165256.1 lipoate--protein ligase family protein [Acidilobaceae archaeon]MDW7973682.1 biotin/lipoate A/B protein ligase family protein [Sulfolobales archaeon]